MKKEKAYLESLVCLLARSDIFSSVGDDNHGDVVIVTSEELLSSCNDMSNNDSGSQREENVLVVWVKNKSIDHLACRKSSK